MIKVKKRPSLRTGSDIHKNALILQVNEEVAMNKPVICFKEALLRVGLLAGGAAQAATVTDNDFSEVTLLTSNLLTQLYSGAPSGASLFGVQPNLHIL